MEALVDKGTLGQLENQLLILPDWEMNCEEHDDHLRAVFTRTKS